MTKKMKQKDNTKKVIGITAAVLAATYFLYGSKDAPKNRKKLKGWMLRMKGEVLEKIEGMKDISEEKYHQAVDTVTTKYKKLKTVEEKEADRLSADLKKHWKAIKRELGL